MLSSRRWLQFWVSAAVALAFADASIVLLGLPQIVVRLHTSIPHVVWVIAGYNAALIVGSLAIVGVGSRWSPERALMGGLALFGLASVGSGTADSFHVLLVCRVAQGLGGALLLCGSLPRLSAASRSGEATLARWAAAAAIGAALGPAAGGLLTQAFDWRAIFLAQAPVAALAGLAIWLASRSSSAATTEPAELDLTAALGEETLTALPPTTANIALFFISAGLIGALFLVTLMLINVWEFTPLAAAAALTLIPFATAVAGELTRGRSPARLGAIGAVVLAAGLTVLALISHRQLGWALLALALCGSGLGLSFPPLTDAALEGPSRPLARAAKTIAARDGGLLVGLLILTPIFVNQLNTAPKRAIPPITTAIIKAPMPTPVKLELGAGLLKAQAQAPPSELPNINPTFAQAAKGATPATKALLLRLKAKVLTLIENAATGAFRSPLIFCAVFALLVLPLLALRLPDLRRASSPGGVPPA